MQEKQLFEYAVIRVIPKVEREEFLNVGIILYCPKQQFLSSLFTLNETKLRAFSPESDLDILKKNLHAFQQISLGSRYSGPIGSYDPAARFRWLTATRSTVIQCSKVHPGLTADAVATLSYLHRQLVL